MTKKSLPIWILLLLLWIAGSSYCYVCSIRHDCGCQEKTEVVEVKVPALKILDGNSFNEVSSENFTFDLSTAKETIPAATDMSFSKLVDYLKGGLRTLNITGFYKSSENGGEPLGLKRADKIKSILVGKGLDAGLITTSSKLLDNLIVNTAGDKVYGAIDFNFGQNEVAAKQLLVKGTTVHFVTGSNDLNMTPEITTYMKNLEEYFSSEAHQEHILLSGYTDNVGNRASNIALSLQRAKDVKANLVSHGIPENLIETEGFGPDNPVASNDTPEGKAQNRRVEIKINE